LGTGARARIRIRHEALIADYISTSSGVLETVFPALTEYAAFEASLPSGITLTARARVADSAGYERVATLWTGAGGLSVHAFEFGATLGGSGHVWSGAPRAPEVSDAGRGGYLLSLGTPTWPDGARAEVYSFPAATAARSGSVRIELGAEVTARTCGTEVGATTLQTGDGLPGAPVDVTLTLPDCGGADGTILLKNLARDLKIAAE
jgi:hypothetical protein